MKFTKIPNDTFQKLQLNAGIMVKNFDPVTAEFSGQLGATSGGIQFQVDTSFTDLGEDVDNCPKNTMELMLIDSIEAAMSGSFASVDAEAAKFLIAACDVDENNPGHLIPRNTLNTTDFKDVWWIGDYSNVNTGASAGYLAIHLKNALNTGGFQIQSEDKGKGKFAFTFKGHYSMNAQDEVPYELFIRSGASDTPFIVLDEHTVSLEDGDEYDLGATVNPEGQTITWNSANTSVATVSGGTITAEGSGNTIITASITVDGVTYSDTCTVVVAA